MTFDRIRAVIETGHAYPLGEALKNLTPEQRKECAKDLIAYEKAHRASDLRWQHGEPLAIAGAGLLPSASALAPWLVRYRISLHHYGRQHDDRIGVLVDVLRHRELTWMPDLVGRLASRMPARQLLRQDLLTVILEFCGEDPPDSDGFLLHLLDSKGHQKWRPGFDVLFPRLLEVVGSGFYFGNSRPLQAFLRTRANRQVLVDGCLARLQQGGSQSEMAGFIELHEAIAITLAETVEHVRDYLAMLSDSRSTVAALAQDQLKRVDDAGKLDFGLLCEASRWVFGRTEKKLVRAQLTWLGKHGKANPDDVVLTAAELFAHESDDLRGQAVTLIAKHLGNTGDTTQAQIRASAEQLPGDLAARLGGTTSREQAPELAAFEPRPFPSPIATLDELTGELLSAFGRNSSNVEPSTAERIIEAVVRFAWQDREALGEAIRPFSENSPWFDHSQHTPRSELIGAVLDAPDKPRPLKHGVTTELDFARNRKPEPGIGAVGDELAKRLYEIGRGLVHLPKPALVSTPTDMSGLIEPAVLADRLARAEAEGWEPWQRDLRQAFQRLPLDTDPAVFASLTSKAAAKVRDWLANRTDPEVAIAERTYRHPWRYDSYMGETGLYATVTPGLEEPEQFLRQHDDWGSMKEWWPSLLPAQREVVAAHLIPHLRARTASKGGDGPLLPMLAEAHGPAGPALHLALSYGLGAELTVNRAHAVDAVLVLAARDQLDGRTLGDFLGRLLDRGDLVMNRVVPCLRDAARSGAARQVWDALTAAVPRLWTHNRAADVIELAVELAQLLQPGGTVGGLAEAAARKGSSKAVVQAKRLMSALGGKA
ncbi:DUF6493 family protein [Lentzea sp. NEAU-D7]|uniref:DUF6493 family protein n=1 Tax=Lentzea sp. NEAU-D7 TaxID=2994667 RepID=UPI00224B4734|nr:DUF6493 family protein [Lentzea sp. NEAU-D7]MCX2947206.1 DUF6493 family protein [Lentzea sp. NEAU-D7]